MPCKTAACKRGIPSTKFIDYLLYVVYYWDKDSKMNKICPCLQKTSQSASREK